MKRLFTYKSIWFDLFWLSLLIASVNFLFLGRAPFFVPDEGRYAEIAREMLSSHQFIIPYLDGVIFFDKPPLSYWLTVSSMKLFGYSEWAARSPDAIAGLMGCLATYFTASKLFSRRVGILSALILSSSILYFGMSHYVTTDMPLTLFLTLSLYSFLLAFQFPLGEKRNKWLWAAYLFSGLAVMTKGLIGVVFPGLIIIVWIAFTNQWRLLKEMRLFSGIFIIACITLPWLILVQKQVSGFLHFYFIDQQISRYATPIAQREMALGAYIAVFFFGLFPWVVWLPQSIKRVWPKQWTERFMMRNELYLLIWPGAIFLFFAGSHSILIPYLLPVLPPLAILISLYIDSIWRNKLNRYQRGSVILFSLINLIIGVSLLLLPHFLPKISFSEAYYTMVSIAAIILLLGAIIACCAAYYRQIHYVFTIMLLTTYLFLIFIWMEAAYINEESIRPLALTIKSLLMKNPNAVVVNYGRYHQDLPFYIQRLVTIVNWRAN